MSITRKIIRRAGMMASTAIVPKSKRHVRQVRGPGFDMLAFINEDVGRILWLTGKFEPTETRYFQQEIKPEDTCFDVGGNVGYMAMLFASKATAGEVHVFEPIELNASLIQTNAALNQFDNVVVNNVAVGEEPGTVTFSVSTDSAYSSIHPTGRQAEAQSIEVPLISLDMYIAEHKVPRVDILKADVEGAEELVINGAKKLLTDPARRPRIILLELFDANLKPAGSSIERCIDRMQQFGYRPHVIQADPNRPAPFEASMANKSENILFTPA